MPYERNGKRRGSMEAPIASTGSRTKEMLLNAWFHASGFDRTLDEYGVQQGITENCGELHRLNRARWYGKDHRHAYKSSGPLGHSLNDPPCYRQAYQANSPERATT